MFDADGTERPLSAAVTAAPAADHQQAVIDMLAEVRALRAELRPLLAVLAPFLSGDVAPASMFKLLPALLAARGGR